jgi:nucleoside 2-deoxyribosyltransferase
MKLYLASQYARREELCGYAVQLRAAGHQITARWITGVHKADDGDTSRWRDFAADDLADIDECECLIAFTEKPTDRIPRGSRHVELGYAIGRGKDVIVVGPRENVFCCLDCVLHYPTWQDFVVTWLRESIR